MPQPKKERLKPYPAGRKHHDVFISYAQMDKPIADAICSRLESRRIRCWIAPRDVPPAQEFPAAIIEGIEQSQFMVLVFSSHSNSSPHVIRELTNAVNKGRIIIPFRVEDVPPSKSMEYLISVPHWLDAITPPLGQHIEKLADTIENILATDRKGISCPTCGAELSPLSKFCNSCGTPVTSTTPEPQQAPEQPPTAAASGRGDVPPESRQGPADIPSTPEPAVKTKDPEPGLRPGTSRIPAPVLIGCAIIIGLFILVYANPLGGLGGNPANSSSLSPAGTNPIDYRSESAPINLVTLTVQPTRELPKDRALYIEVSKDPTNAVITVQFNGGSGGNVVLDNSVILTRSDGTEETGKLDFSKRLSAIELQGTRGTDRIRVVVDMGTEKRYVIIDKLMPFRARNID